jgi:ribosomal-protein-alanine N-acetyltransferase
MWLDQEWQRLSSLQAARLEAACFDAPWGLEDYQQLAENVHFHAWGLGEGHDASPVAFVAGMLICPEVEVLRLGVQPEYRRRGLAQQLLQQLKAYSQTQGCCSCWLEVHEANTPARALYEQQGFQEVGRRKRYYRQPPGDALILRWDWS